MIIKSIAERLANCSRHIMDAAYRHIYRTLQVFARDSLGEIASRVNKDRRPVSAVLKHVRDIALEVVRGQESAEIKSKSSPPAYTQIHLIRSLLHFAYSPRARGMLGGFMKSKDFKDSEVTAMKTFCQQSLLWPYMIDLQSTVNVLSDLSNLWLREFHLELARRVQFSIDMSLPWMIIEEILNTESPELMEYVPSPARNKSCRGFKQQGLL